MKVELQIEFNTGGSSIKIWFHNFAKSFIHSQFMCIKKNVLITISLNISMTVASQDTVWISKKGLVVPSKDSAERYNVIYKSKADTQQVKLIRYLNDGTIQEEINYFPYAAKTLNGIFRKYSDGRLVDERIYSNNRLDGYHKTFWEDGKLKRSDLYENGKFTSGRCYGFNGEDTAWFNYEKPASFPGGNDSLSRFIAKHFYYPKDARDQGVHGTVKVKFIVAKDGSLEDIQVINSVHNLLDAEAIRLVKLMPKWMPASQDGRLVKMYFILPVTFFLSK